MCKSEAESLLWHANRQLKHVVYVVDAMREELEVFIDRNNETLVPSLSSKRKISAVEIAGWIWQLEREIQNSEDFIQNFDKYTKKQRGKQNDNKDQQTAEARLRLGSDEY